MNDLDHREEAERLLDTTRYVAPSPGITTNALLAAQVHATLALADIGNQLLNALTNQEQPS